jgi:hypothetical protein
MISQAKHLFIFHLQYAFAIPFFHALRLSETAKELKVISKMKLSKHT